MVGTARKRTPSVFISYSRTDNAVAAALEDALERRGLAVWRDVRSIAAGERWSAAIEEGIRRARGLVVVITETSASSEWVTYEYAFATGARSPVVAVIVGGAKAPKPIRDFQVIEYSSNVESVAERIDEGILAQSRAAAKQTIVAPVLTAKFQEVDGEIERIGGGKTPSLCVDLWIEHAPRQTRMVAFEIPDLGFKDRQWTVTRKKSKAGLMREFLTDDMDSWGDVEIWARGIGPGAGSWSIRSTLYKALSSYYRKHPVSEEIQRALKQIRQN